jgi:hypothetical protein
MEERREIERLNLDLKPAYQCSYFSFDEARLWMQLELDISCQLPAGFGLPTVAEWLSASCQACWLSDPILSRVSRVRFAWNPQRAS